MDNLLWATIIGFGAVVTVIILSAGEIISEIKAIHEELNRYRSRSFAEGILTHLDEIERVIQSH
jgi:hypothetical protein